MKLELDVMEKVNTREQLDRLFDEKLAILFKHSTRCPVSAHAFSEVRKFHESSGGLPLLVLHVVEDRSLSDYVEERTGVRHESPQVLLLQQGRVTWHASHFDIVAQSLASAAFKE